MKIIMLDHPGIVSSAVRLMTRSKWSHVAIVMDEHSIMDATGIHGVAIRSIRDIEHYDKAYAELDCETPKDWLMQQLGKPYDRWAILGLWFNHRDWREDDKWFCSELVAAAAEKGGLKMFNEDASLVTPRDIAIYGGLKWV